MSGSTYYIKTNGTTIYNSLEVEYGVGVTSPVEMYLVNIVGKVTTLISGSQLSGNYKFTVDISELPTGVYYLVYRSPQYSAIPIKFVKQ